MCRRGNLQVAVDLYKKAQSYVPDNMKLKQRLVLITPVIGSRSLMCSARISEIDFAIQNNVEYKPQPKKKKSKAKKGRRIYGRATLGPQAFKVFDEANSEVNDASDDDGDQEGSTQVRMVLREATNSPQKQKRSARDGDFAEKQSPPKKQRKEDDVIDWIGGGDDVLVANKHNEVSW